ncbi:hypothetical protein Goshw_021753 [Gossypium schwendimanii]|uniref:RNase H type-1 domain-containing protein n=1 Tax=Gossypium schwendimanii TaxID=34291 RepID=A0A7J9MDI7_GOSSC|nr:hypothetical protein [Gossypium schwendimanii]
MKQWISGKEMGDRERESVKKWRRNDEDRKRRGWRSISGRDLDQQAINLVGGVNWTCLFRIIIWRIWKNRNLRIFQGLSWSADELEGFCEIIMGIGLLVLQGVREGSNSALVRRILLFLKLFSHWNLQDIPRKENKIADRIVKLR